MFILCEGGPYLNTDHVRQIRIAYYKGRTVIVADYATETADWEPTDDDWEPLVISAHKNVVAAKSALDLLIRQVNHRDG